MVRRSFILVCTLLMAGVAWADEYQFLQTGQSERKLEDRAIRGTVEGIFLGPSKASACRGRVKLAANYESATIDLTCAPSETDGSIGTQNGSSFLAFPTASGNNFSYLRERVFWQLNSVSGDLRLCARLDHFPQPDSYTCAKAVESRFLPWDDDN